MEKYWEITPKRFNQYLDVYTELEEQRAREMDYSNYVLGKYVAFAMHDPKKYPRKPFLWKEEERKVMTPEEMEEVMKKNTITLGGTINGG